MLDYQKQIERLFSKWSWKTLIAMMLIAAVGFVAFDVGTKTFRLWQPIKPIDMHDKNFVKRWLNRSNPYGFQPITMPTGKAREDRFNIVWFSGSTTRIKDAPEDCTLDVHPSRYKFSRARKYSLQNALAETIETIDGRTPIVQEYFQSSLGIGDLRRAVNYSSLNDDADAIIFSLNPIVMFNETKIMHPKSRQGANILSMAGIPKREKLAALTYLQPSEIVLELLGRISYITAHRGYAEPIKFGRKSRTKFPSMPIDPNIEVLDPIFGPRHFEIKNKKNAREQFGEEVYTVPFVADLSLESIAAKNLKNILRDLKSYGRPVIFYIPPVQDIFWTNIETREQINRIATRLHELIDEVDADNFTVKLNSGMDVSGRLEFRNAIHAKCAPAMVDMVVDLLREGTGAKIDTKSFDEIYGERDRKKRKR